jgi:hypothetical protein
LRQRGDGTAPEAQTETWVYLSCTHDAHVHADGELALDLNQMNLQADGLADNQNGPDADQAAAVEPVAVPAVKPWEKALDIALGIVDPVERKTIGDAAIAMRNASNQAEAKAKMQTTSKEPPRSVSLPLLLPYWKHPSLRWLHQPWSCVRLGRLYEGRIQRLLPWLEDILIQGDDYATRLWSLMEAFYYLVPGYLAWLACGGKIVGTLDFS